jgi:GNAT superfamily N-acetyltransferase
MPLSARPATADDYSFYAELQPLLESGDAVPPKEAWSARMLPGSFVCERNGAPVGYAFIQLLKPMAYVRNVMVSPLAQGQGVGTFLMRHLASWLRAQGCSAWCLNVKPDNTPALELYRGCGMREHSQGASLMLPWSALDRLPPAPRDITVRPIDPAEDEGLDRTFDMVPGLLTLLRVHGHLLGAEQDGALAGLARFDPNFPGVMPIRLRTPSLARPLLEALQPFKRAPDAHVLVFVEGDAALKATLEAAGAQLRLEVLHLQGPLG